MDGGIHFDVTADDANFQAKISAIKQGVSDASKQLEAMFSSIKKGARSGELSIEELNKYFDELTLTCEKNGGAIVKLGAKYKKLKEQSGTALLSGNDEEYRELERRKSILLAEIRIRRSLQNEMRDYATKLQEESQKLEEEKRKTEESSQAKSSLRTRLRELRESLVEMEAAGQRGTAAYKAIQAEAAKLTDAMADAQAQASILAHDQRGMQGLISGLGGVAGAFSAAQGAVALFSDKNEDLQKVMLRVQAAMSIVQGLQQVQQTINKDSAFMLVAMNSLKEWWAKIVKQATVSEMAETAAINANTASQAQNTVATGANVAAAGAGTVANWSLAASFKAVGLAIKSIPVFGWIIAGISALVGVFSYFSKKSKEAKKAQQEFFSSIADNAYKPIASIEQLASMWSRLGGDINAKNKFIKDSQKIFDELGFSIENVEQAEKLLVENKDKFIDAQIEKAKAAVYLNKANEKVKKLVEKQLEYENMPDTVQKITPSLIPGVTTIATISNPEKEKLNEEIGQIENEIKNGWENAAKANTAAANMFEEIGLKTTKTLVAGSIAAIEEAISEKNKKLRELVIGSKEYNMLNKEIEALKKMLPSSTSKKNENEAEKRRKLQEKLDSELLAIQKQNQEDEIDLMEEGTDKKLAQIEHDFEEQKKAIEKHKSDIAKFNKELGTEGLNEEGLTSEQQNFISKRIFLVSKRYEMETETAKGEQPKLDKTAMNEYLKEYGDYMEKRNAIIELYNEKIANAKTKGEQLSLGKQMEKELAGVDDEARRKTSIITKLFDDMSGKAVADMRAIADEAEKMLAYLNGGEFKLDDSGNGIFGLTREQFNILVQSPEKLESIKNEIENVRKEADAAEPAFKKIANGLKSIFSSGSNPSEFKKALSDIQNGLNEVMQAAGFLSDSLKSLGDSFGSNALGGIAEGIDITMGVLDAGMKGAEAGSVFGPIGAAAGAALGVVTSLSSAIAGIHDKKNEKRIQRLQDQINILEKSYDKLGDSIEEAYSKDASGLIEDQNKLLEQQKILIQQQIREEEKKKKTNKGRIEEWEKEIEEIDKVIEENKEKAVNAIFGEDLKSAIENFAEAYADAWSSGEDKAVSAKETVKKMMKQMVIESIKAAIQASGSMEKIRQKLQEFYSDNVLSDWEQEYIYKMAEEAQKELDAQFGWADKLLGDSSSYSQEASSKGFQAMSQDVGEELNGRFTALQISNEEIKNQMLNVVSHLSMMASVSTENNAVLNDMLFQQVLSNGYLEDIARHTKLLNSMKTTLEKVRDNTGRL